MYGDEVVLGAHPGADPAALRTSAQAALFLALGGVLKLFAPVLPHICEECWSWYHSQFCPAASVHTSPWPPTGRQVAREGDAEAGTQLVQLVALVRKWKSERNVSIKKPVAKLTVYPGEMADKPGNLEQRESVLGDLLGTTNSLAVEFDPGEPPADAARIDGNPYSVVCELADEAE
ncbi:MAG TPA: hypothetical protein ENO21_01785 [Firmicutes bacterium]|nr:hypothetical protein [Bacillota bacterium]